MKKKWVGSYRSICWMLAIVCGLALYPTTLCGQASGNFSFTFHKTDYQFLRQDLISGKIYYARNKTILKVEQPINQVLFYEKQQLNIYYPDENRVLKCSFSQKAILPFFQLFIGIINNEFNPAAMGCEIADQYFSNDTLIINWEPLPEYEDLVGKVQICMVNNNIVTLKSHDSENQLAHTILYTEFVRFNHQDIPQRIVSLNHKDAVFREEIVFEKIESGKEVEAEMKKLVIPNGTEIQEIQW